MFNKRHSDETGEPEIAAYVSHLATGKKLSASTQNQALSALIFVPLAPSLLRDPSSKDMSTAMIYCRVLNQGDRGVRRPIDPKK